MKIESGKFYKLKNNDKSKYLCIKYGPQSSFYWNYYDDCLVFLENEKIEEWKEPMTKEVWVFFHKDGGSILYSKEEGELFYNKNDYIGAKKVTLVEGEWS